MNTKELRIGNYIFDKHGDIGAIDSIGMSEFVRLTTENYRCESSMLAHCNPIPLTDEWLVKFGFDKSGYKDIEVDEIFMYKNGSASIGGWDACCDSHCYHVKIRYVHQLQNLYFSLTGKEFITISN